METVGRRRVIREADEWLRARRLLAGSVIFCLSALLVSPLRTDAKQKPIPTRTISGMVLDSSGRGVSGASVVLTDIETNKSQAIYTGSGGNYVFDGLSTFDDFRLQAHYHGMTSKVRGVSSLDSRGDVTINLTLLPPEAQSKSKQ